MTAVASLQGGSGWTWRRCALTFAAAALALPVSTILDADTAAGLTSGETADVADAADAVVTPLAAGDTRAIITFDGTAFSPALTRAEPGTVIEFRNEGTDVLAVVIEPGGFEISPIPAGGAGITMLDDGSYEFDDVVTGAMGRILVGTTTFGGIGTDPVEDHIPDAWFPPEPPELRPPHPRSGVPTSTSRIRVSFVPGTTVADAEAALARAGAVIVGGMPNSGIVLTLIAGTPDHAALDASLDALRSEAVVNSAAASKDIDYDVLPAPPEQEFVCFVGCPSTAGWSDWSFGMTDDGLPIGDGIGTWAWEAPRFPQAWNLADNVAAAPVVTGIIDGGFDPDHADLTNLTMRQICKGDACSAIEPVFYTDYSSEPKANPATGNDASWSGIPFGEGQWVDSKTGLPYRDDTHGTHVAGTIGAVHETTGYGMSGANPGATMIALGWKGPGVLDWNGIIEELLNLKEAGHPWYEDVRVLNLSGGTGYPPEGWAAGHRDLTCGPGDNDDHLATTMEPCLPWTDDDELRDVFNAGQEGVILARRMVELNVVFAQSAGNRGNSWCVEGNKLYAVTSPPSANCTIVSQPSAYANSAFTAASAFLDARGETNPIFVVEALAGADGFSFAAEPQRAGFSQVDGHLSAPGYIYAPMTARDDGVSKHGIQSGTSMATPLVAGLLSYLIQLDPTVDVATLRDRVATFTDTFDPDPATTPAPRIDAYGSVLRVPGALEAMLDVDDGSDDGNRRVIYGPGGGVAGADTDRRAAEDLTAARTIDIADFRVFRDIWLAQCAHGSGDLGCERARTAGIDLDGSADHPKKDANQDGCVSYAPNAPAECPAERFYPRVDFNGSGHVDADSTFPMEIDGTSIELTDLGVLVTRFAPATDGEGWYEATPTAMEATLQDLLVSGDVEVNLAGLLAAGATDVEVELIDLSLTEFVRPLTTSVESMVITAPAGREIELVVRADRGGTPVEFRETLQLKAGEDVRYDPCNVIRIRPDELSVAMGADLNVRAELQSCDPVDLAGVEVLFQVTRNGAPTDSVMVPASVSTTADGVALSVLDAGFSPGTAEITVGALLPVEGGTIPVSATAQIEIETGYAIVGVLDSTAIGQLGSNPSIAADGNVTFTRRSVGPTGDDPSPPFDQIWRSDDTGLLEISRRVFEEAPIGAAVPAGSSFGNRVDAKQGDFAFVHAAYDNEAPDAADREFREFALRLFGYSNGAAGVTVMASSLTRFLSSGPLIDVGIPVRNDAGQEIVPIQRSDDITERLAQVAFGTLSQGPMLGIKWPRLADDGTSVGMGIHFPVPTTSGGTFVTSAVVAGELAMGNSTTASVVPLAVVNAPDAATPTEWTLVGDKPDISATGDVIAFIADRGPGPSTYLSVRVDGNFTAPVAISGPDRAGTPELDLPSGRRNLLIDTTADEHDLNVGVIHHPAGDPGLLDDQVIVSVFGRPDLGVVGGGLYTIPVRLGVGGSILAGDARAVVQIDDPIEGSPVELIGWHRALNSSDLATSPSEHQLAYWVRTATGEHIVQSIWLDIDTGGVAPLASSTAARSALTENAVTASPQGLTSTAPVSLGLGTTQALPVLIVSDISPTVGEAIVATNRSIIGGELAYAKIDYDGNTQFPAFDLGQQELIAPPIGPFTISLTTTLGSTVDITFDVAGSPSVPPIADAGGPYAIETGDDLILDASGSSDSDGTIASYAWDLDDDGDHDDAQGASPRVPWAAVVDFFCGGACDGDGTYPISVEVTDDESASDTAATTVAVDFVFQDYSLAIVPTSQPANPGKNHVYRVEVGAVGGFTGIVSLSVDPLPDGYRTTLTRSNVAAPDSVDLTVFVPSDATEGSLPLVVRGVSGTIEHDTTGSAEVSFGLIPVCYETVSARAVDTYTGAPIPGRSIRFYPGFGSNLYATTDADGRAAFPDIQVQSGLLQITAENDAEYFEIRQFLHHRCGDPIDTVFELVQREYVAAQGQVVLGVPDPADASVGRAVVATDTPVENANVRVNVIGAIATPFGPTAPDGNYLIDDIPLAGPDNADRRGWITADAPDHWPFESGFITFTSGPPITVDVPLVPVCSVRAGARGRVTDENGVGLAGRSVRLEGSAGPPDARASRVGTATTDADGYYEIPIGDSFLGRNNAAYSFAIRDGQFPTTVRGSFVIDQCGDEVVGEIDYVIEIVPPPPPRVRNTTTVTGRVIDAVTGAPIRLTARVKNGTGSIEGADTPGADGRFEVGVLVGYDEQTLLTDLHVSALENIGLGYRGATIGPITVTSDEPYDVGDILVQPIEWAALQGRVFDVATGEPLANASVSISSNAASFGLGETSPIVTDADGYYEWNHLAATREDKPFSVSVRSSRFNPDFGDKYWQTSLNADLVPGQSTVQDFELLRVCENVTVRGIVIDAVTRDPIQGVRIVASNSAVEFTDENGFFLFEGMRAGTRNTPTSLRLTASASGYITQTRTVSIFCGATIDVSFGVETGSGSVLGTVTDETGAPIEDAFVGSGAGGSDTTVADGSYRIDDIPLGIDGGPTDWDITATHPDGRQIVLSATVNDGGETVVDFVFPIPVNTPPIARDVAVTVEVGASVDVTLDGFDADGDALSYVFIPPTEGSLSGIAPDLTYLAPTGFDGIVTFTYTTSDAEDTSTPGTVTITVEPPNNPPTADDQATSVIEGESVAITLTGDDPDGDPLTYSVVLHPDAGFLTGTAPNLTFYVPAEAGGTETSFLFVTDDGDDESSRATVTITIEDPPPNNPPTADDISTSVVAGESVGITLTGDDLDGDPLTYAIVTWPTVGAVTGTLPNLTYHAPADGGGQDVTLTYTTFDGTDTSATATVTITIEEPPPNNPPEAFDIVRSVVAGHSVNITLSATDPDGDPLTFSIVDAPSAGTMTGTPPNMQYEAPSDGTTQVTFTYRANDGEADSNLATVTINIETPPEFGLVFGRVTDDLGNPIPNTEIFSEATPFGFTISEPEGDYFIDGVPTGTSRFFARTPDGSEMVRTVTVLAEPTELNFVFPTDGPSNLPPSADDIEVSVASGESVGITLTGSDPEGGLLDFFTVDAPPIGSLDGLPPNLTYTAPAGADGEVTFQYVAHDGLAPSGPATVTITIEPDVTNTPPVADDITTSVTAGESVGITLTGSDGDSDPLTFTVTTDPALGSLTGTEPNLTYNAPADAGGQQTTFQYTAFDGQDTSTPATVTITINPPPNTPPVADDITTSVTAGESVGITLTGSDGDDDPITFTVTTDPALGSLTGTEPNLTYNAPADAGGQQTTFQYTAFDGQDTSTPATVTITITPPPDRPPSLGQIGDVTMNEGDETSVTVSASDPDGDAVALAMIAGPGWASFSDQGGGAGSIGLTPADDATETITVQACANALCDQQSFTVTVLNVDPALQIDAPASTDVGAATTITGIVTDPGDDQWTYQIDCGSGYGAAQSSAVFECTFASPGPTQVAMRVVDDDGGEGTDTASIDVIAQPEPELSVTASNDGPAPWGVDVQFTASPDGSGLTEPLLYRWDLDGDGSYDTSPSADSSTTTQYATPGNRTAEVEVCSGARCATDTTEVTITKRPSSLSTPTGPEVQYSDTTTISSTLTDGLDGTPLAARDTTLTVRGAATAAATDASGVASVDWIAHVGAGPVPTSASFGGDEWYEPDEAGGTLLVTPETARLEWVIRPVSVAESYDVHVVVREDEDGSLGDLTLGAVVFEIDEGCDGSATLAGPFPVVDAEADGIGDVVATIPGLATPGCITGRLSAPDGGVSGHYAAPPIDAQVADATDGFVTGGGRYDTTDGWVSIGFVARSEQGVLSGHVQIVHHGPDTVQHRSTELTGLTITDDPGGGSTATVTATFLQKTDDGWVETEITLVVHDGGKGKSVDWAACDACPPGIEDTFRGQITVHRTSE